MASADVAQPVCRPGVPPPAKGKGKGAPPPPKSGGPKAKAKASSAPFTGLKLRPLFWAAVAQPPPKSVWQDLVAPASIDVSFLEKNFALTTTAKAPKTGGDGPEKVKRHRVLDDRTSQRFAIAFRKLPSPERLTAIVDGLEDFPDGLPAEAVIALSEATQHHQEAVEQIRQLKFTDADIGQLDLPERYLWVVGKVPFSTAKLACGSLLVSSACELPDLRRAGEKVGVCCQGLRKSSILQKFASTALVVGNVMNRGTARSGIVAVTLPDALLKFDELRISGNTVSEVRPDTLLDFVAQAVLNESSVNQASLCADIELLLCKTRSAQTVSLEDVDASCRKISQEAAKAKQGLQEVPASEAVARLAESIQRVNTEAELAMVIVENARKELAKAVQWSCTKSKVVKSDEWFEAWGQLLEQVLGAFSRASPSASLAAPLLHAQAPEVRVLRDVSLGGERANRRQSSASRRQSATELLPGVKSGTHAIPKACPPVPPLAKRQDMTLDDEARAESLDLSAMQTAQASKPLLFAGYNGKENACS